MRMLIVLALAMSVTSCAYMGGGADYQYRYTTQDKQVELNIHSTRAFKQGVKVHFDPQTGAVDVEAKDVQPGPDMIKHLTEAINSVVVK